MSMTTNDFFKQLPKIYPDIDLGLSDVRLAVCRHLYENVAKGTSPYYLGRLHDRESELGPVNYFPLAMKAPEVISLVGDDDLRASNQVQVGEVLAMNDKDWTIVANDCWMLGGIHNEKEYILLGSGGITDEKLQQFLCDMVKSDNEHHPLSVTGREILGLGMFGYHVSRKPADSHIFFTCKNTQYAAVAHCSGYHATIVQIEEELKVGRDKQLQVILSRLWA